MLACHAWLRTDWFVRAGFTLVAADGCRWAMRDERQFEIDPECACGPDLCPPHPTEILSRQIAA